MAFKPPEGLISDEVFSLPAEYMQTSSGLALDIGSTVGKIIYRSNKEYKDGQPLKPQDDAGRGQVHFAMFPRGDAQGMIDYIKEHCDLVPRDGQIVVNSSGGGSTAFRTQFEAGLNCKLHIMQEYDCFCKAFLTLEKTMSEDEMFVRLSDSAKEAGDAERSRMSRAMEEAQKRSEIQYYTDEAGDEGEAPPRLLVMGGSGMAVMQLNTDGTFTLIDGLYTAGSSMYGLCSILTGENDFQKLVQMAEKSDGRSVDLWLSDLVGANASAGSGDGMYEVSPESDRPMFPYGKGSTVPADQMDRGDLVWSVFNATAMAQVQKVYSNVRLTKARHVYLCGNLFRPELMRNMVVRMKEHLLAALPLKQPHEYHFLRHGGVYGALGAFLHTPRPQ